MQESFSFNAESSSHFRLGGLLPSLFGGEFKYVTTCDACGTRSERREDFQELSVPISGLREENVQAGTAGNASGGRKRKKGGNVVDVQQVWLASISSCLL